MEGVFTISLDFELHWGVFDKRDRAARETVYKNTLKLIPKLLELFEKYVVHATWATVGSMFAKDWHEWEQMKPAIEPTYQVEKYSAYRWVSQHGLDKQYNWAHFAPDMIRLIEDCPGQELATHTFSHYYCLEQQQTENAFDADLRAARVAALKFNSKPVSLVFPRNQFNPDYLKVCYDNGIKVVRSNPDSWYWSPVQDTGSKLMRKFFRTSDAYVQLGSKRTSYPLNTIKVVPGLPLQLPASRFLRPWNPRYRFANGLRLRRLKQELRSAAELKECYHLWWHPENFGEHPDRNMESLRILLQHYKKCKEKYGMKSWNMGEYAENLF